MKKQIKKISVAAVAILLLFAMTGCNVKLTDKQSVACEKADEVLQQMADLADNNGVERKLKKVDGKIVYIGTIDYATDVSEAAAKIFQDSTMPILESVLHPEDVYVVLYLNVNGEECYRLVDSELDSSASY